MKKVLIIGVAGQDGYYLTKLLVNKGYEVYGVCRLVSSVCAEQKRSMSGIFEIELSQSRKLSEHIKKIKPDEIYYLAAHHFSSQGTENRSGRMTPFLLVNLLAPNDVLETLQAYLPETKFFYAASAQIFGCTDECPQTELTPHRPDTPYAISKSSAVLLCRYYRRTHNIHTTVGILYNHESPRRSDCFVTSQIASAAALAAVGKGKELILRDLTAVVDWGAAEDYVHAMWLSLQQTVGDEYIISSGYSRTIMDFANEAFAAVGLRAENYVFQKTKIKANPSKPYIGDNSKIQRVCGWMPEKPFTLLVKEMVEYKKENLK